MNNVTSSVFYTCLHIGARDHNEYIVPRAFWEANLPNIIEAVFCRTDCGRARQVHQAFLDGFTPLGFEVSLRASIYPGACTCSRLPVIVSPCPEMTSMVNRAFVVMIFIYEPVTYGVN